MKKIFLILLTVTLLSSGNLLQSHGFGEGYGGSYGGYRGGGWGRAGVVAPLALTGGILAGEALSNDGYYDNGDGYYYN